MNEALTQSGFSQPGLFLGAQRGIRNGPCVLGAPLDVSASHRPGTALAPSRIREASWALEEFSPELDLDVYEACLGDIGDLALPIGDVRASLDAIKAACLSLLAEGAIPVVLGGEHLITLPIVEAQLEICGGSLGILYLDAHADLRDSYEGVNLSHATVARRLCELVQPHRLVQAGVRSGIRDEFDYAKESGVLQERRLDSAVEFAIGAFGAELPVHVSIDIDVIDPAYAPGVGCPEPGGPSAASLLEVARDLGYLNVVSIDLVEVSPPYDPWGPTAFLAAKTLREAILSISKKRIHG